MRRACCPLVLLLVLLPAIAAAQIVGVAVDSNVRLAAGKATIAPSPAGDSAVFFDFSAGRPRRLGEVAVPTSYLGVPASVAISPDGTLALVSASMQVDPAKPDRYVEDDRLSVIDLSDGKPRRVQTLRLGVSPSAVRFSPDGTLALVPSNPGNSLVVLAVEGHTVSIAKKLPMPAGMGPLDAAFAPDGRHVLLTQADGQRVWLVAVQGRRLELPPVREITAGVTPFAVAYCGDSGLAVVSNFGNPGSSNGDVDTVSLLDLSGALPRVVDTVSVGSSPEGVDCSADGRYAVATVQNMSNRPASHPLYSPHSLVVLLRVEGKHLRRVDEAPIGAWAEGVAFLGDSRTLLAQSIVDRAVYPLRIQDGALVKAGPPIMFDNGAPVGIGVQATGSGTPEAGR
jgi:DNA-binding beta-propeller fold protein YncE